MTCNFISAHTWVDHDLATFCCVALYGHNLQINISLNPASMPKERSLTKLYQYGNAQSHKSSPSSLLPYK